MQDKDHRSTVRHHFGRIGSPGGCGRLVETFIGTVDLAGGVGGQRIGGAVEYDLAVTHADHPVAIGTGGIERMQIAKDDLVVAFMDLAKRIHDDLGVHRIKGRDRLIGQDHVRILHQGAGNGDALLLSAGQFLGAFGCFLGNAQAVERRQCLVDVFGTENIEKALHCAMAIQAAEHNVGDYVKARHKVELLKHHGAVALPAAHHAAFQAQNVTVLEDDLA